MTESEEPGYDLVMPFVTVTSRGGPHDDTAYTAGWEMGALDARLEVERPPLLEQYIHAANVPQADLLAMKHGYGYEITEHDREWSHLRLTRKTAQPVTSLAAPRVFRLQRDVDVTGASGTGHVADGVLWPDGTVTVKWRGEYASEVSWPKGVVAVEHVHGHDGRTRIVWDDEEHSRG